MKSNETVFERNLKIGAIIVVVVGLIIMYFIVENYDMSGNSNIKVNYDKYVTRVIDGDTFVLGNSERVRLICIDTPEIGEDGYEEATQYLEDLILNKEVRLEKDVNNRDRYERLLRYVYLKDGTFVNKEIVKGRYGKIYRYGEDTRLCDVIGGLEG